jgi:hypothetical protein
MAGQSGTGLQKLCLSMAGSKAFPFRQAAGLSLGFQPRSVKASEAGHTGAQDHLKTGLKGDERGLYVDFTGFTEKLAGWWEVEAETE